MACSRENFTFTVHHRLLLLLLLVVVVVVIVVITFTSRYASTDLVYFLISWILPQTFRQSLCLELLIYQNFAGRFLLCICVTRYAT
jgi:hypothetical protein